MKFAPKKAPTKPGFYLINTDTHGLEKPILIYCDDGRYTYGSPAEIADHNESHPIENLTKYGFWMFWGPINPVGVTA